jgi:hypothetical protein
MLLQLSSTDAKGTAVPTFVNTESICYMMAIAEGTHIVFENHVCLSVKESTKEILEMLSPHPKCSIPSISK